MAEVVVGLSGLERRLAAVAATPERFMQTLGLAAVREQKLLVARKTRNLGRSIHLASVSPTEAVTLASAGYASYVEFGTRPHEIAPRTARVLAWAQGPAGGAFRRLSGATRKGVAAANIVFAARVHHPGTRPEPFMVPGAETAIRNAHLEDQIISAWNGAA